MIHLPDSEPVHLAWRDESRVLTFGELKREIGAEEIPQDFGLLERTLDMWGEIAVRNLSPRGCQTSGAGPQEGRA